MTAANWALWLLASAAGAAFALSVYRRRETPGRGRNVLAALRGCSIALLLLLVFDPGLPGAALGRGDRAVIVDGSLSMSLPGNGATLWETAVTRARAAGESQVTVFGDGARTVALDALGTLRPDAGQSRLLPALQAVAEAGRRRVTVYTDGAIEDADEVVRWLPRLGLDVSIETVAGNVPNRGLSRVRAPSFATTGEPVTLEFDLVAAGTASGPVTVVVREDGNELARTVLETPAPGRLATGSLTFTAGQAPPGGYARYELEIEADDAVPDDDRRTLYLHVTDEPAGAVLVSFQPDWEPRFLQPVLERSLGVPVRGYLHAGDGWIMPGTGMAVGEHASEADVRRAVARADLLILHAFGAASPEWAREAAAAATRLMVFPAGEGAIPGLPLPPMNAIAADWYLSPEIPASPVARLLAGIEVADVPPLQSLRTPPSLAGSWAPAMVSRGRRGSPFPVALGGTTAGRRWAVALGEGYWRWAFWSPASRDIYERLWSALGGWVLGDAVASGPDAVAPAVRAVPRGAQPAWIAFGMAPDSLSVRLTAADGRVATDTIIAGTGADTLATHSVEPGRYTYDARAWTAAGEATGSGEITVESWSPEFTRAVARPADIEAAPEALGSAGRVRTPLHASMWPWILLVVLLSVEWVLRRRWGLR